MKSNYELEKLAEQAISTMRKDCTPTTQHMAALICKALDLAQDIERLKVEYYSAMEEFELLWTEYHA